MKTTNGFLLVNKAAGPTSFDIIRKVRRIFSCKQVGHAGTLDPDAEGLLVCAIGNATRLIEFLATDPKVYEFTVKFGEETDTLDASGTIIKRMESFPAKQELETVLSDFTGTQQQIPPAFSAIKINGRRAYDFARKGKTPVLKSRTIHIYSLAMTHYDDGNKTAGFCVKCSGGTYVRALARDIAARIATCAHTTGIRRTACGDFTLNDAYVIDAVAEKKELIIKIDDALKNISIVQAAESVMMDVSHGRNVKISDLHDNPEKCLLFHGEDILAVLNRIEDDLYHPEKVFISSESNKK